MTGDLLTNAIKYGEKSLEVFNKEINKKGSKQLKAEITFPPSMIDKFLRNFGYSKVMVAKDAPVYLASIAEYICLQILNLSLENCKHVRLTIRDLELTIRNNTELDKLFTHCNISLLGGGIIPFIHDSLLLSSSRSTAIKTIKKQQKNSDNLIFSKLTFERIVRNSFLSLNLEKNVKISKDVFIVLQYFMEQYIVNLLRDSNFIAIHANRIKLLPIDINIVLSFYNKTQNPYNSSVKNNINLLSIENINIDE
jgi:histone H3/H4